MFQSECDVSFHVGATKTEPVFNAVYETILTAFRIDTVPLLVHCALHSPVSPHTLLHHLPFMFYLFLVHISSEKIPFYSHFAILSNYVPSFYQWLTSVQPQQRAEPRRRIPVSEALPRDDPQLVFCSCNPTIPMTIPNQLEEQCP